MFNSTRVTIGTNETTAAQPENCYSNKWNPSQREANIFIKAVFQFPFSPFQKFHSCVHKGG